MKLRSSFVLSALLILLIVNPSQTAPIRIVAALPDFGSIASYIGGDKVEVSAIARAVSNPHSVEVFPLYMARVSKAHIYLKCGLGLDQWSDAIIDGSRNNRIVVIDCSNGVSVLERPAGKVDASMGDIHLFGNPHFWLNPENGFVIGQNILAGLQRADPANSAYYSARFGQFKKDCASRISGWKEKLKPLAGAKIITYHSSWAYLADAFGFSIVAKVEPFPGIPPTGNHLAELVNTIKKQNIAFIIQEPYFSDDASRFLSRQTGAKVHKCSPSCQDVAPGSYFAHFDDIVNRLAAPSGGK